MAEQIKTGLDNKPAVVSISKIAPLKLADDPRVHKKFVQLYRDIHGKEGEMAYNLEKFHFNKLIAENKELQKCTPLSLYGAFLDICVQRISIDPSRKLACLIPQPVNIGTKQQPIWETRAVLTILPHGELFLRQDCGQIAYADNPVLVYEGDVFAVITDNKGRSIRHEAKFPRTSNRVIACFMRIIKPDGAIDFTILDRGGMRRLESYSLRKNSKNGKVPDAKANALYSSGENGQPDPGFWEAKTIKHAFDAYPKVKLRGQFSQLESDADKEDDAEVDYGLEDPVLTEDVQYTEPEKSNHQPPPQTQKEVSVSDTAKGAAIQMGSNDNDFVEESPSEKPPVVVNDNDF